LVTLGAAGDGEGVAGLLSRGGKHRVEDLRGGGEGAPDFGSPPRAASGQAYPLYEELYIVSAWPMVRMVCAAEVSSACFFSLSICGTAEPSGSA